MIASVREIRYSALVFALALAPPLVAQTAEIEHFERSVRPVLVRSCQPCHGPDQQLGKLRVDSRAALLQGGVSGSSIVPGKSGESLLVQAIRQQGKLRMPLGGRLKDGEIEAIAGWVDKGAIWPAAKAVVTTEDRYRRLAREHWAFQPVKAAPAAEIDSFIQAKLAAQKLHFAKPADRRTLIRRVSYVLTGLPPAPEEIDRFVKDPTPAAYENLVDRLLASPHFGEQWARHWLDLVRFGETRGYEWNYEVLGAWRYRDYLIRAFNADVPYDQLIREHIAGDLLPNPRLNAREQLNESVIGTAFYRLGEAGHDDCIQFREIATDVIDSQIDTLTKTFQGLTVACARCHNHKLDPIPADDYYALYGVLNSSHHVSRSIDSPQANAPRIAELRRLKREIKNEAIALWLSDVPGAVAKALAEPSGAMDDPAAFYRIAATQPWKEVQALYKDEAAAREAFNRAYFQPLPLRDWNASGMGLRDGAISPAGSFALATEGDRIIAGIYPEGVYTHLDSPRLNGAIRYPRLPAGKKNMSLLIAGDRLGSYRTVIENCAIGEGYKLLESPKLKWQKGTIYNTSLPLFTELTTRFDNPRLPDRPGMVKEEWMLKAPQSWFGVSQVVVHDIDELPRVSLSHLAPLFDTENPRQLRARYEEIAKAAIERWATGHSTEADVLWLCWLLETGALANTRDASPKLLQLTREFRAEESRLAEPRVVDAIADLGPARDYPVFIGGSAANPGPLAKRTFLRYLINDRPLASTPMESGRRELAERIANPANPLTSRVMVNRLWHHVFGRGLVATPDNFGTLSDKPSHPELLDALAARFVNDGWSVKRMIRMLVLSRTFRQSNEASSEAKEIDPQNALLHHYPVRRLTAEGLRDSILAATGTLRPDLYGPSIDPYRDKPQDYRRLFSGPLDGEGRRSIYLKVTRMEAARFLETFDYPSPMATVGARDVTNVPAQALTLLNDPFVISQAAILAERVMGRPTFDARLDALFRFALGRTPDPAERERFTGLSRELASLLRKPANGPEVWSQLAHATLNLKEFLYIQ